MASSGMFGVLDEASRDGLFLRDGILVKKHHGIKRLLSGSQANSPGTRTKGSSPELETR
ncbi:hypothetical protein AAE478_006831 [Parahypoxylon ruwenzoriense]